MRGKIVDGRYELGASLGSGGMGEVYLAHDSVLERDVALKILRSQYAGDEEFAERFRREARSAASLSHRNIVQVYDRGEAEDGTSYIAMEYVPGGTLKEQIERRGTFGDREAAAAGAQIADALEAAHERDVIHRDIKPQNVLVRASGGLKVTDFGIARAASSVTSSASGAMLGTVGYLSPEQAMGEPVGPASDLYSLGVVLYEMLTGELPFDADTAIAVCLKHVNEPPRPPNLLNPGISEGMNALVLMLLSKHPADRYGSAMSLLTDLERVRDGLLPTLALQAATQPLAAATHTLAPAPPVALSRVDAAPKRGSTPRVLAVAAVATAALLGIFLFGLLQDGSEEGSLPRARDFAREILDPPARAAVNTTKTGAGTAGASTAGASTAGASTAGASTGNQTGATGGSPSSASPAPSAAPSPVVSPAAPPERPPVVPVAPPEDQSPAGAQYGGDD